MDQKKWKFSNAAQEAVARAYIHKMHRHGHIRWLGGGVVELTDADPDLKAWILANGGVEV